MVLLADVLAADKNLTVYQGDLEQEVMGLTTVDYLKQNNLLFFKNKKFLDRYLEKNSSTSPMGAVVASSLMDDSEIKEKLSLLFRPLLISTQVEMSMVTLSKLFYDHKFKECDDHIDGRQLGTASVHPTAWIAQNVFIGKGVTIAPHVRIYPGSVIMSFSSIMEGSIIFPNVTIYPFTYVGKGCRIHSGSVIGADGFGYHFAEGAHQKIWHQGGVVIEDGVEIGASTTIDMGTFIPTKIGRGTKIDNQVQVGHNCQIGAGNILCGQVGFSGSVKTGAFCVFGGKSGVAPDAELGNQVQVAGGSLVLAEKWDDKTTLAGMPAQNAYQWMREMAWIKKMASTPKKED